jgi:hypothetical protein
MPKSGLEIQEYGRRDPSRWPRDTLYPQKLTLTSPTSGGRSVGIVRSRTQTTEFVLFCLFDLQRLRSIRHLFWVQETRPPANRTFPLEPRYETSQETLILVWIPSQAICARLGKERTFLAYMVITMKRMHCFLFRKEADYTSLKVLHLPTFP